MNLLQQVSGHNAHGHNGISGPQTTDSPTICSIKIPLTQFIHGWCWCTGFPLLWCSIVKSLTHRRDSSPFGSLSKRWMDTGIRRERRGEREREWREMKGKCCSEISASVASKLLRQTVNQLFRSNCIYLIPLQKPAQACSRQSFFPGLMKSRMTRKFNLFHAFVVENDRIVFSH